MDESKLKSLLKRFKNGELNEDGVLKELRFLPFEDIGYAKVDHHRAIRTGFPEVVYGAGKTDEQIVGIAESIYRNNASFLVTRCAPSASEKLFERLASEALPKTPQNPYVPRFSIAPLY